MEPNQPPKPPITILGAGVIGLTTAIRLMENGHSVNIVARSTTPNTTSDVAAAFWCPYRVGPHERALTWATDSYQVFAELSTIEESGVFPSRQREIFKEGAHAPWYRDILNNFRSLESEELQDGFVDGYEFDTYLIETPIYMRYLTKRVQDLGARILEEEIHSLEELEGSCSLLVNCSGVWARHLVNDEEVYPIRGQVVVTEKLGSPAPPITTFDNGEFPTYIVPRKHDCLLGGTAQAENWDQDPDPEIANAIRQRCEALVPSLADKAVLRNKVGLRPGRKEVRLELDTSLPGIPVIHNYGHGGSGYTLSWGCAEDVVNLVKQLEA